MLASTCLLIHALRYYGLAENTAPGKSNPTILQWLKSLLPWVTDDETSWCAAFINAICAEIGLPGTNSAAARSFLQIGMPVTHPVPGDVVIFWRVSPSSWQGHVALFVRDAGDKIYVLGGNQSNQVNIQAYPKARLLGYRRLNFTQNGQQN